MKFTSYKFEILLFGIIMCCSFLPEVMAIERIEGTFYCPLYFHTPIITDLEMEEGEVIHWQFTTTNHSFKVMLGLWINSYTFVTDLSSEQTSNSGDYTVTHTGEYWISAGNFDLEAGYIHIVLENKQEMISGYHILTVLGILGLALITIIKREHK